MTYSECHNNAHWTTKTVGPFLRKMHDKVERWCDIYLGNNNYCSDGYHYSFKYKKHAEMFALRWL